MLTNPQHHSTPFPYFDCEQSFDATECVTLSELFVGEQNWQRRDEGFYQCFLREVTEEVPQTLRDAVVRRIREITGLPLIDYTRVTAQRMDAGQSIGVHSDRPLLGYEIARLVVHLNPNWVSENGGVLELLAEKKGPTVLGVEPRFNRGFGFILHEQSFHRVTKVTAPRHSVVFNFWHPANTEAFANTVSEWLADLNFATLPEAIDPMAAVAEARLPEEDSYLASLTAALLQRWGHPPTTIVAGYARSAGLAASDPLTKDVTRAINRARWVAGLHEGVFDVAEWQKLGEPEWPSSNWCRRKK